MKSSEIGGQAVIEGVMMKNKDQYAVAVRKPDGEITVDVQKIEKKRTGILAAPIIRGVVAFVDSMVIGIKTLSYSATFFEDETPNEEEEIKKKAEAELAATETGRETEECVEKPQEELTVTEAMKDPEDAPEVKKDAKKAEKQNSAGDKALVAGTVVLSIAFSVLLFMLLPMFLSRFLSKVIESQLILTLVEGGLRILIFIGYVVAISQLNDIKRVFAYHGAEHKSINCIENGLDLTVENVRTQSRQHKRCGTSFLLFVVFISLIFFLFIRVEQVWLQAVIRVLLVPVIAGISYEIIRFAGNSDNKVIVAISKPGFALQRLTTREPDDSMIEVAIASVEAVFDWKPFVEQLRTEQASAECHAAKTEKAAKAEKATKAEAERKAALAKETEAKEAAKAEEERIAAEEAAKAEEEKRKASEVNLDALDKVLTVSEEEKGKELVFKDPYEDRKLNVIPAEEEDDEILKALDRYFVMNDEDDT